MDDQALASLAAGLLGHPPRRIDAVRGGGNSRLYRLTDDDGAMLALKVYPDRQHDQRDRLGTEYAALSFLHRHGVDDIPRPLARDEQAGAGLYQWIGGAPPAAPDGDDLNAVIAFAARLHALGRAEGADALPPASEACFAAQDIVDQLDRRLARLAGIEQLSAFLAGPFHQIRQQAEDRARAGYARRGWDFRQPLPQAKLCLSPSDFGFHNTLKQDDGRLVFLDFEYFGWDDPVRLAADFIQHPGMCLPPDWCARFRDAACRLYGAGDDGFATRLDLLLPLVGLRWCLIMLNEFLPERWKARQFAGMRDDRETVLARQMAKVKDRMQSVSAEINR